MSNWNLPPGVTDRMIDEAFGGSEGRRGTYTVTVIRTVRESVTVEVEAGNESDARFDAEIAAKKLPAAKWTHEDEDVAYDTDPDVEGPREPDPDDGRDARADWEYERDR